MATMRRETWIDRSAADVWTVVGDPAAMISWFPNLTSVTIDGDRRTITLTSGMTMIERFSVRGDLRRFQYRLEGPLPIEEHLASIDVIPASADQRDRDPAERDCCLVVYSTDVLPHTLGPVLDGAIAEALTSLKQLMEAT